jgi:hypothetical protein
MFQFVSPHLDSRRPSTLNRSNKVRLRLLLTICDLLRLVHSNEDAKKPQIFLTSNYCTIHNHLAKGSTICCRNMTLAFRSITRYSSCSSRFVSSLHQLTILGFYIYILKYLTHHQLRSPAILALLSQSTHTLTPPDALIPAVRKLSHQFVHPGVSSEDVAAGLNAIREICHRRPWAMEEDLLGDLIGCRKSRDKGVWVPHVGYCSCTMRSTLAC